MTKRILTVLAHPDDAETMAGGTLLTWARRGDRITLCLITDGDKGTADGASRRPRWPSGGVPSRSAPPPRSAPR
jgi:LmbE family N-acetylglucosaminyl deacetylase